MSPTGAELRAKYPTTRSYDRAAACLLLDLGELTDYLFAYWYPSREAAGEFAAANLEHHGHPTVGTAEADGGWVSVIDIGPAIAKMRAEARASCPAPDGGRCRCDHHRAAAAS